MPSTSPTPEKTAGERNRQMDSLWADDSTDCSRSPSPEPEEPKRKRPKKNPFPKLSLADAHSALTFNPYTFAGIPYALNHIFGFTDEHGSELSVEAKTYLLDTDLVFPYVRKGKAKMPKDVKGRYELHARALHEALKVVSEAVSGHVGFSWEGAYAAKQRGEEYRPGKPVCWTDQEVAGGDIAATLHLPEDIAFFTMLAVFGGDALRHPLRKGRTLLQVYPDIHRDLHPCKLLRADLYEKVWLPFASIYHVRFQRKVYQNISDHAVDELRGHLKKLVDESVEPKRTVVLIRRGIFAVGKAIRGAERTASELGVPLSVKMQEAVRDGKKCLRLALPVASEILTGRRRKIQSNVMDMAKADIKEISDMISAACHPPVGAQLGAPSFHTSSLGNSQPDVSEKDKTVQISESRLEADDHFARLGVLDIMNAVSVRPDHRYFLSPSDSDPVQTDEDAEEQLVCGAQRERNEIQARYQRDYEASPVWSEGKQVMDLARVGLVNGQRHMVGDRELRGVIYCEEVKAGFRPNLAMRSPVKTVLDLERHCMLQAESEARARIPVDGKQGDPPIDRWEPMMAYIPGQRLAEQRNQQAPRVGPSSKRAPGGASKRKRARSPSLSDDEEETVRSEDDPDIQWMSGPEPVESRKRPRYGARTEDKVPVEREGH